MQGETTYVVTLDEGESGAQVARSLGVTPTHVYTEVIDGFAAKLTPEQLHRLILLCRAKRPEAAEPLEGLWAAAEGLTAEHACCRVSELATVLATMSPEGQRALLVGLREFQRAAERLDGGADENGADHDVA